MFLVVGTLNSSLSLTARVMNNTAVCAASYSSAQLSALTIINWIIKMEILVIGCFELCVLHLWYIRQLCTVGNTKNTLIVPHPLPRPKEEEFRLEFKAVFGVWKSTLCWSW